MLETLKDILPILVGLAAPVSGIAGWFLGRRKRQLEGITALQDTVNLLITKNCELIREVTDLRQKYAALSAENRELINEVQRLNKAYENSLKK